MPFQVDQRVRIKENAFEGSNDPDDIALRGQVVTLTFDLGTSLGKDWLGCWEAMTDDGQPIQVTTDEIEEVDGELD